MKVLNKFLYLINSIYLEYVGLPYTEDNKYQITSRIEEMLEIYKDLEIEPIIMIDVTNTKRIVRKIGDLNVIVDCEKLIVCAGRECEMFNEEEIFKSLTFYSSKIEYGMIVYTM